MSRSSLGYEQIDLDGSVGALTVPDGTESIGVNAEGGTVRWRDDGVDPSATVGMVVPDGQTFLLDGHPSGLRLFGGAGVKANVLYWA